MEIGGKKEINQFVKITECIQNDTINKIRKDY